MRQERARAAILGGLSCLMLVGGGFAVEAGESAPVAAITSSGGGVALEYADEDGTKSVLTLPLHTAGNIKYFSAGVGAEERAAKYPAFPLKLIFVAGPKAYLSRVAVTIADKQGTVKLEVPAEQVTGPWLYVDLPAGTYTVTASREGRAQMKSQVTVTKGGVKTLYLRWKNGAS